MPKAIASGTKITSWGGDTWINWWLYPALSNKQIKQVVKELGLGYDYQYPDQVCLTKGFHKTTKGHTLIKQFGGYDV